MLATLRCALSGVRSCGAAQQLLRIDLRSYGKEATSSSVVDIQSDEEFESLVTKSKQLAVVDFTAKWCGPCKMIAPIYEQLSKDHPTVKFTKVDIDNEELSGTVSGHQITGVVGLSGTVSGHQITGRPTFIFYKDGKRLEAFSGAQRDLLITLINKHK